MRLYNTLSQRLESFVPQGQTISIYVCGITPYDTTHLGHAFTYATFDILIRYLEMRGYRICYAQNVTDIDDDILKKATEVKQPWRALGNQWAAHFIRDMQALNIRPPDYFPRATDVIPEIIAAIQRLLQAGVAYESGGNVYFQVGAWPEYGKLSRLSPEAMLPVANERGNRPEDPHKWAPLDFLLWQTQTLGEPAWNSPWGPGRPGWHIECSTMARHFLGRTIDLHGGGADLIFPHHESEIAQAEAASGHKPFVHFWLHTTMVQHGGKKMSKSLGNLVMVQTLLKTWSPDALRLYLGWHHYRQPWSHRPEKLAWAERLAQLLRAAVTLPGGGASPLDALAALWVFTRALEDDLDTAKAIDTLEHFAEETLQAAQAGREVKAAQNALRDMSRVFGLQLDAQQPEPRVLTGWAEHLKRFQPIEAVR